ncbi:anti-sigma regulatory factor (Ser/Thr protein kinase) [Ilumatobacter fluminis]|uniref:Anti-sigma regulatory factor (Ser/Thr protein kinase) n=1 Tax=Ilumatobacter fluminis TaxID=467091 RepID=A0A4R7I5N3_9ACTN|nr:ATP-binding protein [Ilumatobacter fluminis]TDT18680.1 anti-sigma regulatory factor (Ser/Thr protein kinase) [Ilumatobacter fluminis]
MGERAATSITLEAAASQVAHARRFVRRSVEDVDPAVVDDLQLIVSELFTNAVEHGASDTVEVVVAQRPDRVSVTVDSRGPTPGVGPATDWQVADADALNGRGLGIVRELADDLVVERDGEEFIVTATLSLRQHAGR